MQALTLLCRHNGEVAPTADLVSLLWNGRTVSDNSLAIVIADLRRALGDDARAPVYIGTVAKSGYRLLMPVTLMDEPRAPARRRTWAAATLALGAVAAGAVVIPHVAAGQARPVLVGAIANETGDPHYDALARACGEHLVGDLSRNKGLAVVRERRGAAPLGEKAIRVSARLVLWSGQPDVVITAEPAAGGAVVWSGYAFGEEASLPGKLQDQVDRLVAAVRS